MRFRKLRIAWSVVCGVACVLLIVWWVRSYWRLDVIVWNGNSSSTTVRADAGLVTISQSNFGGTLSGDDRWELIVDNASWGMQFWQFDWAWDTNLILIRVPIWVAALAAAILAHAPWIRWSRRFSLRALLIATTLVALVLGIIMAFE